jgi:hypothetical protein
MMDRAVKTIVNFRHVNSARESFEASYVVNQRVVLFCVVSVEYAFESYSSSVTLPIVKDLLLLKPAKVLRVVDGIY